MVVHLVQGKLGKNGAVAPLLNKLVEASSYEYVKHMASQTLALVMQHDFRLVSVRYCTVLLKKSTWCFSISGTDGLHVWQKNCGSQPAMETKVAAAMLARIQTMQPTVKEVADFHGIDLDKSKALTTRKGKK